MRRGVLGVLAAVFLLVVLTGAARADGPIRFGDEGYNPTWSVSYQSTTAKHAGLIADERWSVLLEELVRDFFAVADPSAAEVTAREGFLATRTVFVESLGPDPADAVSRDLNAFHGENDAAGFATEVQNSTRLVRSLAGVWQPDETFDDLTIFDGAVSWYDTLLTEERRQELYTLNETIYKILQDALGPFRLATLEAIAAARGRWEDYTASVVAHQFPWEMGINELCGITGNIEHPPTTQIALLHPLLAVEFYDPVPESAWKPLDEAAVKQAMLVNLLGVNRYKSEGRFERSWGLSGCVSLRSNSDVPAWGAAVGIGRWVDVGYVYRGADIKSGALVFSADFWGLLSKEQSGFIREKTAWLDEVKGFLN